MSEKIYKASRTFTDLDDVVIIEGTVLGVVVRRGESHYNTILNGTVTSVTKGFPHVVEVQTT